MLFVLLYFLFIIHNQKIDLTLSQIHSIDSSALPLKKLYIYSRTQLPCFKLCVAKFGRKVSKSVRSIQIEFMCVWVVLEQILVELMLV